MRILILGGAGFLGQKLVASMIDRRSLRGETIEHITLADVNEAKPPASPFTITSLMIDISQRDAVDASSDPFLTRVMDTLSRWIAAG